MKWIKLHNINTKERVFDFGTLHYICVGERGRGRYEDCMLSRVPISKKKVAKLGLTKKNKLIIYDATIEDYKTNKALIALYTVGTYTRNTYGTVYALGSQIDKIHVVRHGLGAFGDAGNIGTGHEFILALDTREPIFLMRRPTGGKMKVKIEICVVTESNMYTFDSVDDFDAFLTLTGTEISDEDYDAIMKVKNWFIKDVKEAGLIVNLAEKNKTPDEEVINFLRG